MDNQDSTNLFKNKRDQYIVEIRKKKNDEYIQHKRVKYFNTIEKTNKENEKSPLEHQQRLEV